MLHPALDAAKEHIIEFRKSQKKFVATVDDTFAVVGHSMPYTFGRLNNEIVVLLSSLGVSNEAFLRKQDEYFTWIRDASHDVLKGFELLSAVGEHAAAERLFLDGFEGQAGADGREPRRSDALNKVRSAQHKEIAAFRKNDDEKKERVRMLVRKSRRLYGVCDPFRILREGEVHVRITTSRNGASTLKGLDVIVVRNPCLHPGDILKLRAVYRPELEHLVDCVVFASVGKRAAPSMSSGGDLDGDEYFVCWDSDLVPRHVAEVCVSFLMSCSTWSYKTTLVVYIPPKQRANTAKDYARRPRSVLCILEQVRTRIIYAVFVKLTSYQLRDGQNHCITQQMGEILSSGRTQQGMPRTECSILTSR